MEWEHALLKLGGRHRPPPHLLPLTGGRCSRAFAYCKSLSEVSNGTGTTEKRLHCCHRTTTNATFLPRVSQLWGAPGCPLRWNSMFPAHSAQFLLQLTVLPPECLLVIYTCVATIFGEAFRTPEDLGGPRPLLSRLTTETVYVWPGVRGGGVLGEVCWCASLWW
jgi:hypothetical protein